MTVPRTFMGMAAKLGLAFGSLLLCLATAPVSASPTSPEAAPAEWVAYAEGATHAITAWLNVEQPPAPRVRAVIEATRPGPDQPGPPLVVKIWVGRDGAIIRVEFVSLGDAQADQDLHDLLVQGRLPPPPRRMKLSLRLALQLVPHPAADRPPIA